MSRALHALVERLAARGAGVGDPGAPFADGHIPGCASDRDRLRDLVRRRVDPRDRPLERIHGPQGAGAERERVDACRDRDGSLPGPGCGDRRARLTPAFAVTRPTRRRRRRRYRPARSSGILIVAVIAFGCGGRFALDRCTSGGGFIPQTTPFGPGRDLHYGRLDFLADDLAGLRIELSTPSRSGFDRPDRSLADDEGRPRRRRPRPRGEPRVVAVTPNESGSTRETLDSDWP